MKEDLTKKLLENNYEMSAINQIIKGKRLGFDLEGIKSYIVGEEIRTLVNYLNTNDFSHEKEYYVNLFVDILNANGSIEDIIQNVDKDEKIVFKFMRDRIKEKKDYTILFHVKNASYEKLRLLTTIKDENYNISEEDMKKIKETDKTIDSEILLKAYNEGLDVFQYIDQRNYIACSHLAQIEKELKTKLNEKVITANNVALEEIKKYIYEDINKFKKVYQYLENDKCDINIMLKLYNIIDHIKEESVEKIINIKEKKIKHDILDSIAKDNKVEEYIDFIVNHNIYQYSDEIIELLNSITLEQKEEFYKIINNIEEKEDIKLEDYDILYALELFDEGIDFTPIFYDIDGNYIDSDEENREYYKKLLLYYNENPDKIQIEDFEYITEHLDRDDFDYFVIEYNLDINKIQDMTQDQLMILQNGIEDEVPIETINKFIDNDIIYQFDDSGINILSALNDILNAQYKILNKKEENKLILQQTKKINEISDYNEFTKNIIENKLNENNFDELLDLLENYIENPNKQVIYEFLLTNNIYQEINLRDPEKIKAIEDQIKKDPNEWIKYYCDEKFNIEQIKFYNNFKITEEYKDSYQYNDIRKIYNPKFNMDQLKAIENTIKKYGIESEIIDPKYSPEEINTYAEWIINSYIYMPLFQQYQFDEEKNKKITKEYRKILKNIDISLPIKQKNKIKITNEIEMLKKIEKEYSDLDFKLAINQVVSHLEAELEPRTNEKENKNLDDIDNINI